MLGGIRNSLRTQVYRSFGTTTRNMVAIGDKIPAVNLYEGSPGNTFNIAEEAAKGKALIIGVPGAFSPACSSSHVPGYLRNLRQFNDKGVDKFYVVAINDPFVMKAWGDVLTLNIFSDQIKFLADPRGEFTEALDLKFDASKVFGNERSKRYALYTEDGKVAKTFIEPDNTSVNVSDATKVLSEI